MDEKNDQKFCIFIIRYRYRYIKEHSTEIKEPIHNMTQIYANTFKRVLQGILKKQ
jgi:predicted transcriptional regulator